MPLAHQLHLQVSALYLHLKVLKVHLQMTSLSPYFRKNPVNGDEALPIAFLGAHLARYAFLPACTA